MSGSGAIDGFREGEAVGVVLDPDIPFEKFGEVTVQRVAVQSDGVGVLHQACGRTDDARNADPNSGRDVELCFGDADQGGDCFQ